MVHSSVPSGDALDILEAEDRVDNAVGADAVLLEEDHRRPGARDLADAELAEGDVAAFGDSVENCLADAAL
jgi:hypothetical protein